MSMQDMILNSRTTPPPLIFKTYFYQVALLTHTPSLKVKVRGKRLSIVSFFILFYSYQHLEEMLTSKL